MSTAAVIQKFGGRKEFGEALEKHLGKAVPATTMQYWIDTDCIPDRRREDVLAAAKKVGAPVLWNDFRPGTADGPANPGEAARVVNS